MWLRVRGVDRLALDGRWATDLPGCGLPGLYWVEVGALRFHRRGHAPIVVRAGESVVLPRTPRHVVCTDDDATVERPEVLMGRHADHGAVRFGVARLCWQPWAQRAAQRFPEVVSMPPDRRTRAAVELVAAELAHEEGASLLAQAALTALFERALRGHRTAAFHPAIAEALQRMQDALAEPWTVERLARSVGMSRSSFAEAFSRDLGVAPMTTLFELRMERAATLLAEPHIDVLDVAEAVGYRAEASFRRAYRRHHGAPPRA